MPNTSGPSEFLSFRLRWCYLFILLGAAAVYSIGLWLAYQQVSQAEDAIRAGRAGEAGQHTSRVAFLAGKPFVPANLRARICGLLGDQAADAGETEEAMNFYQSEMNLLGGDNFTGVLDNAYLRSITHPGHTPFLIAYEQYLESGTDGAKEAWNDEDLLLPEGLPTVPNDANAWPLLVKISPAITSEFMILGDAGAEELAGRSKKISELVGQNESSLEALHSALNERKAFSVPEDEDASAVDCPVFFKLLRLEAHHRMQSGDGAGAARSLQDAFHMIGFIESQKQFFTLLTSVTLRKVLISDLAALEKSGAASSDLLPVVHAIAARPITLEFARECVKADYTGMKKRVTDGMAEAAPDAQLIRAEICRTYSEYMREVLTCVENPNQEMVRDPNASLIPAVAFLRFGRLGQFYGRGDFSSAEGVRAAKLFVRAMASPVSETIRINVGTTGSVLAEVQKVEADLVARFAAQGHEGSGIAGEQAASF